MDSISQHNLLVVMLSVRGRNKVFTDRIDRQNEDYIENNLSIPVQLDIRSCAVAVLFYVSSATYRVSHHKSVQISKEL